MAEIKETIPFSFDEIYAGIAAKFAAKGYDSPYDGSNLAQLITSMAYTTSMLNANTAININENILSLAQKRQNVIQDSRLLGYEPAQRVSYVYDLELTFNVDGDYTIPKYSKFEAGGKKYYYFGDDLDILGAVAGDTVTIPVKEGNLIKYTDDSQLVQIINDKQYLDIPYTNVEDNGLEVFATFFTTLNNTTTRYKYEKSNTLLMDVTETLDNQFIRLENTDLQTPRIYFVLSGIGNELPTGTIVEINVLQSSGVDGILSDIPSCPIENIDVTAYTLRIKGTEIESIASIKDNAPLLNNTANRVVTANDYKVISQKHSACKEAFIFGGEDEHPIKLGNIFLSFTPEKMFRTFTSNTEKTLWTLDLKEDILNNYLLDTEIEAANLLTDDPGVLDDIRALDLPALKYNIRHPMYAFIDIDVKIAKYALSSAHKDIRSDAFDIIDNYIQSLEIYDVEFFKSNLVKRVDDYLTDVTGLDMSVDFNIMVDRKSVVQENELFNEYNVFLYLDTAYEGTYDNNGYLKMNGTKPSSLPMIDTVDFLPGLDLVVDFEYYVADPLVPDESKPSLEFPVMLGLDKVGTYTIFNDRTTYIRVKLEITDGTGFPTVPSIALWDAGNLFDSMFFVFDHHSIASYYGLTPIDIAVFDTPRYIHLKYPSENIKTLRNTIFKLNKVNII